MLQSKDLEKLKLVQKELDQISANIGHLKPDEMADNLMAFFRKHIWEDYPAANPAVVEAILQMGKNIIINQWQELGLKLDQTIEEQQELYTLEKAAKIDYVQNLLVNSMIDTCDQTFGVKVNKH